MNKPKVATHAGLTLNLAEVKCFHLSGYKGIGKNNTIIVEYKTRFDYIKNPGTGKWEKQEYNEKTELEFPDFETARAYHSEWVDIWQDYLNEQM